MRHSGFNDPRSVSEAIEAVSRGVPVKELAQLQKHLGVSLDFLAAKLRISPATLHRRKLHGRFSPSESDRLYRYVRLWDKALEVFEKPDAARRWLAANQFGLGGATPLDFAETELGGREVENLLGRLEHGVYS